MEESKPILKPISQTSVKKSVKRKSLATPEETEKAQKKVRYTDSCIPDKVFSRFSHILDISVLYKGV